MRLIIPAAISVTAALLVSALITQPATFIFIEDSGIHIPTENILQDYVAGVCWALVLLLSIFAWPVSWPQKRMLATAWIVKSFTALVVMLPYEQRYYGLDCWQYFKNAHGDLQQILTLATRGSGDVVVAVSALLLQFQPDSYHALKLSFALIGLAAVFLFYRAAETLMGRRLPAAFWMLLLYPSILFWSSILGKDPLVLLAISFHVWGLAKLATQNKFRYLMAAVTGVLAVSAIRVWMGPILIVPCAIVIVTRLRNPAWRALSAALMVATLSILGSATIQRFSLQNVSGIVEATQAVTDGWEDTNSSLQREVKLDSVGDLILFVPQGLFDTFFRPLPGDVANLFGWMAGFENLGLLCVSVWAAFRFHLKDLRNSVFLWASTLLLTWGLAYCLFAYRDLGTAVRFKLQILPVMLGLIGYLLRKPWGVRMAQPAPIYCRREAATP